MLIKNGTLLDEKFEFRELELATEGESISEIGRGLKADGEVLDAEGGYIIPGLFDIHTHGCAGHESLEGTIEAFEAMADFYGRNGVTSHLCTTGTASHETLRAVYARVREYLSKERTGSTMQGINMEGVFFSKGKKGAHNQDLLKLPDLKMFNDWQEISGGNIKLCCLAPELEGAEEFIKEVKKSMTVSMAHTEATYDQARKAIEWGVSHATHTFNGMPSMLHRQPGPVGAIFDDDSITAELISDGRHVHPTMVRLMFKVLGTDRVCLISDSMEACGLADGVYTKKGRKVIVENGLAHLEDGTIAGSTNSLMDDLRCAVSFGIPLAVAVKAASFNPARAVGLDDKIGSLKPGKQADIVILNKDDLSINKVIIKGKIYA